MKFLRFTSEAMARAAFAGHLQEGEWPAYIDQTAIDIVGIIYRPTGAVQQSEDGEAPVLEPLPGWHINLSERVPELQQYEIEPPSTPSRIFAGSDVVSASRVPAEVARWQAKMVLMQTAGAAGSLWDDLSALRASLPEGEASVMLDAAMHELLYWRRASPTVEWVADQLGLSSAQVDALFIAANALTP